jgi:hypothetical protein
MADRDRDLSKILHNVEQDITGAPAPANITAHGTQGPQQGTVAGAGSLPASTYAPQRERERMAVQGRINSADSLEQIQGDMRRAIQELELRCKAVLDEIKRAVG